MDNDRSAYTYDYVSAWDYHYEYDEESDEAKEKRAKIVNNFVLKLKGISVLLITFFVITIWFLCPCIKIGLKTMLKALLMVFKPLKIATKFIKIEKPSLSFRKNFKLLLKIIYYVCTPLWFPLIIIYFLYILQWTFRHEARWDVTFYFAVKNARKRKIAEPNYEEFLYMKNVSQKYTKIYSIGNCLKKILKKFRPF
ncbi:UNVERIFIED_CONTAM: hypothetical protein RMT77_011966 [Armadillidium vulgare]